MVEIQYDDTCVLIDVIKISSLSIKTNCHRLLVPGVRGGGGVWYNKTNMTSLWVGQHDSLPLIALHTCRISRALHTSLSISYMWPSKSFLTQNAIGVIHFCSQS